MILTGCGSSPPADAEPLNGAPDYPLFDHSVTWTGDELIVLGGAGGDMDDGLLVDDPRAWNPSDGWRPIAAPPGPTRNRHSAVWTGEELVIWSGTSQPFGVGDGLLSTAAAYDPDTDSWRRLASSPLRLGKVRAIGIRTGSHLLFGGGDSPESEDDAVLAIYDLNTDSWRQERFAGPVRDLAAVAEGGYVLWSEPVSGDNLRTEIRVGRYDPESLMVNDVTPAQLEDVDVPTANLLDVDGRLGLWVERRNGADRRSQLLVADPSRGGTADGISWEAVEIDLDEDGGWSAVTWSRPVWSIGPWIAVPEGDLTWYNTTTGSTVVQTLTREQRCATDETTGITADDVVVAWTSPCIFVDDDGSETTLTGAYLFHPPDTAAS
jgi:hypothetical protein